MNMIISIIVIVIYIVIVLTINSVGQKRRRAPFLRRARKTAVTSDTVVFITLLTFIGNVY